MVVPPFRSWSAIQWWDIAAGAQTERRGGAGPAGGLLGGKDPPGRLSGTQKQEPRRRQRNPGGSAPCLGVSGVSPHFSPPWERRDTVLVAEFARIRGTSLALPEFLRIRLRLVRNLD